MPGRSPLASLPLRLAPLLALLAAAGIAPAQAQDPVPTPPAVEDAPPIGVLVDAIEVRGNERLEDAIIIGTSGLRPGDRVQATDVQQAIRRLMATGNFEIVEARYRGDPAESVVLVLEVEERIVLGAIEFEGLERISARAVRDTIDVELNRPLDPGLVVRTERAIRDLLGARGVEVVSVDTVLTPMTEPEGAHRLTFRVREGHRIAISEVVFRGNQAFPASQLRRTMQTRPEGFLWYRTGRLDREVLDEDLYQRLPDFYASQGHIDFEVTGDTLIVDPRTGKARLVVDVEEGPQYRLGEFDVEGNTRFSTERLRELFTAQYRPVLGLPFGRTVERERGAVFDQVALEQAVGTIDQLYRNQGYLYAQVLPVMERREPAAGGDPVVDVTLEIREGRPAHINRIDIVGNTHTHDAVIRERIFILPGQVYNEDRLIQSYQSISGLGFFETPLPMPDIQPDPETGDVDVVFRVEEQQTGSINFGTSFGGYGRAGGLSGFLGYSQPNLFGQAKQAEIRAEYGWRNTFEASYTDPSLFGSRNSGSVSLFHMQDRFSPFADGRRTRTGGSLRFGIPVLGLRFTRAFVGYTLARTSYDAFEEADDPDNVFLLPPATASGVSLGVTRDTKNHPVFPTVGTRQSITTEQTGGPLGGDGNFQRLIGDLEWWVPVGRLGGTQAGQRPVDLTLGLRIRSGTVFGNVERFPLERFYMGGTQDGVQLRGYSEATITPRGYVPREAGVGTAQRLGDAYLALSTEYAVRLTDNISVAAFADAGNVWDNASQINPARLFRGAGLGVTIVTPFGPMGLDYAYGFDRVDVQGRPDPGWQFHFKLGPGF